MPTSKIKGWRDKDDFKWKKSDMDGWIMDLGIISKKKNT
jgi:hypothetical protein